MLKRVNCFICERESLSQNEVGLNKKLISQNVSKFHCMDCLADYLEIDTDDLLERIEDFKDSDCPLFE